jgi:hypothetical protein
MKPRFFFSPAFSFVHIIGVVTNLFLHCQSRYHFTRKLVFSFPELGSHCIGYAHPFRTNDSLSVTSHFGMLDTFAILLYQD